MKATIQLIDYLYWNHTTMMQADIQPGRQPVMDVKASLSQPDTLGLGSILSGLSIGSALCTRPAVQKHNVSVQKIEMSKYDGQLPEVYEVLHYSSNLQELIHSLCFISSSLCQIPIIFIVFLFESVSHTIFHLHIMAQTSILRFLHAPIVHLLELILTTMKYADNV